ncbi:MAG: septum formation initiator family protein [Verrucomicrobia bacterium]|nr:septum formation initiator family protein [Verrucomicrobiota bacterium]
MSAWVLIYRFSWGVLAILIIVGVACMFWPQYMEYRENQRRVDELEQEIQLEEELLKSLKRKQERFRSDPRFVEQIAREMGLAKSGETVFKFLDDSPYTASQQ